MNVYLHIIRCTYSNTTLLFLRLGLELELKITHTFGYKK